MIETNMADLYVALRCIDRMNKKLLPKSLTVPEVIHAFVDAAWEVLHGSKARLPLTKMDRQIGKLIVDEQDAGFEESLVNRLYYALSDLVLFFKFGDTASVDGILEEALESSRYEATNAYLVSLGGHAKIWDAADEEKIEADARVIAEMEWQAQDRYVATTIANWETVQRSATNFESSDKTVRIWIEQGTSIQIKCVSDFGDPVELSIDEAMEIAETLRRFVDHIK